MPRSNYYLFRSILFFWSERGPKPKTLRNQINLRGRIRKKKAIDWPPSRRTIFISNTIHLRRNILHSACPRHMDKSLHQKVPSESGCSSTLSSFSHFKTFWESVSLSYFLFASMIQHIMNSNSKSTCPQSRIKLHQWQPDLSLLLHSHQPWFSRKGTEGGFHSIMVELSCWVCL